MNMINMKKRWHGKKKAQDSYQENVKCNGDEATLQAAPWRWIYNAGSPFFC